MLGKKKNLSTEEIRAAAQKIRQHYDDYIIQFLKPLEIKDAFEERYLYALRKRLEMSRFFLAEKQALDELWKEDERQRQKEWNKSLDRPKEQEQNFADRIIAQNENKIKDYPIIKVHSEASKEICHLFGALGKFEKEHWPNIQNLLRKYFKQFYTGTRMGLESEIIDLCCSNLHGLPPRLTAYAHLFERFPRDYSRIEKEEKLCLTESAVMLKKVKNEIIRILTEDSLTDDEKGLIAGADNYVSDLILDFRLKDLAKLQRGVDNGYRSYE